MDHGGCTLLVEQEDGRILKISPDPSGDLSHGHMCRKARALPEIINHPKRLKKPLKRAGQRGDGKWSEISWDEALETAANGFNSIKEKDGARAVAFCQGAPKGLEHFVLIRLANTFGSPNIVGPQNVCHMPREIAGMLTCGFFPVSDYGKPTESILVWGSNLTATNEEAVICTQLLNRLKADKSSLVVVDPRKTELAQKADIWLPVKPGTDVALALGFLNVIIEEGLIDKDFIENHTHGFEDLEAHVKKFNVDWAAEVCELNTDDIRQAARLYGKARPGSIQWGNGIEQNINNFDTARALLSLMAVTGNMDAPGGNIAALPPKVIRLGEFVRGDMQPGRTKEMLSASYGTAPGFVIVAPEYFKKAILTDQPYPMRGAYIHVSNPVLAWSDSRETYEALKKLEFIAVSETFMSPTAALADIVFPAATHLEFNDIGHYGLAHGFMLARPKVVDPVPECRPNIRILNDLANKMGLSEYWWDNYEDMLEQILAPSGLSYEQFAERGILHGPERYYKFREKGFKTKTGKVELLLTIAEKNGLNPLPEWSGPAETEDDAFPLLLTGHKSPNFFCSDHRYVESLLSKEPDPVVEVHPETAAEAGLAAGDDAAVETRTGCIKVKVKITERIKSGVLSVVHGWWMPGLGAENPKAWNETTLNVLTSSETLNRALGSPNLRAIPARLKSIEE